MIVIPLAAFQPWAAHVPTKSELQIAADERDIDELIADLKSENAIIRATAAHKLEKYGPRASRAIPVLIGILDDEREVDPKDIGLCGGECNGNDLWI